MKVLVTGATGFVGGGVVRALLRHHHHVLGLVRDPEKARPLQKAGAAVAFGDMNQPETYEPLVRRVEAVVHAAQAPVRGRWTRRKLAAVHESDALMTRTLARACLEQGKRLIYTSGSLTHAGHGERWLTEDLPPRPCLLAQGHAAMLAELAGLHRDQGLNVVTLSPGFVYGPGGFLRVTAELLVRGRYRVIGDGQNYWSLLHLDDLGEAYALALERGAPGASYFLSDGEPLRRRSVIDHLADALGCRRPGRVPGWLAGVLLGFPLVEALTASQRLRCDRARRQLGWAPHHLSFAGSLPAVIDQLRASGRMKEEG
jgi:nucleoside-diphosphate-sugar epimerase